jgi:hypothetical protein
MAWLLIFVVLGVWEGVKIGGIIFFLGNLASKKLIQLNRNRESIAILTFSFFIFFYASFKIIIEPEDINTIYFSFVLIPFYISGIIMFKVTDIFTKQLFLNNVTSGSKKDC